MSRHLRAVLFSGFQGFCYHPLNAPKPYKTRGFVWYWAISVDFLGHVEIAALKFVNNPGSSRLRKGATAGLSGNAKRKPPQSVLVV